MPKSLKILVPVDFSRHSRETLQFALSLREYFASHFLLVHVVPTGEAETFATLGGEPGQVQTIRRAEALAELERLAEHCRSEMPEASLACRVIAGIPFKEICRMAEEEGCQLIVIGTHGRTGIPHLLMGSTAERVVQHASCPVLSIKPGCWDKSRQVNFSG